MNASTTRSNRILTATIAGIAALLMILGFTVGANTDNAVNGSVSSSVSDGSSAITGSDSSSVSDGSGVITNDLGQPELQEMAIYPVRVKYLYSQGDYAYFQKPNNTTTVFTNPYGYRLASGSCYTVDYTVRSNGYPRINNRTLVAC